MDGFYKNWYVNSNILAIDINVLACTAHIYVITYSDNPHMLIEIFYISA